MKADEDIVQLIEYYTEIIEEQNSEIDKLINLTKKLATEREYYKTIAGCKDLNPA